MLNQGKLGAEYKIVKTIKHTCLVVTLYVSYKMTDSA